MRILLVYASAGAGHLKAAHSLFCYLRAKEPSWDIKLVDLLDYCHPLFSRAYSKSYNFFVRYAPWIWSAIYHISKAGPIGRLIRKAVYPSNRAAAGAFLRLIEEEPPDLFISTHFLASELICRIKEDRRLISIITDFSVHPFWVSENTDLYAVASDFSASQLNAYGVERGKIVVTGIPIDAQFARERQRRDFLSGLGLDPGEFTVCIASGSFGIGPIEGIVEELRGEAQLLVVTANNKKLLRRLSSKKCPGLRVFAFVDNMWQIVAASDIVLTKPGGLTISELLAAEKPFIFIAAIPGQERENMEMLKQQGIAGYFSDRQGIKREVLAYKDDPHHKEGVIAQIKKARRPFACRQIHELICQSSSRAGS